MGRTPEHVDNAGLLLRCLDGDRRILVQAKNRLIEQRYVGAALFSYADRVPGCQGVVQLDRVPFCAAARLGIDDPLHRDCSCHGSHLSLPGGGWCAEEHYEEDGRDDQTETNRENEAKHGALICTHGRPRSRGATEFPEYGRGLAQEKKKRLVRIQREFVSIGARRARKPEPSATVRADCNERRESSLCAVGSLSERLYCDVPVDEITRATAHNTEVIEKEVYGLRGNPLLAQHWEEAGENLVAARWQARAARWIGVGNYTETFVHCGGSPR